jgi:hypothetical protein
MENKLGLKLKEAIDHYGSLQKATESVELKNKALKEENQCLEQKNNKMVLRIKRLDKRYIAQRKRVESLEEKVRKFVGQYKLFESFLAMMVTSPSVSTSLKTMMELLKELTDAGWALSATPDQMRSLFVSKIMGDHLKCFRCKGCGNRFITNTGPKGGSGSGFYIYPACHSPYQVVPDDSFLKAMVSEKQLDDINTAIELKQENDILKPLKCFLEAPCKIWHTSDLLWEIADKRNLKGKCNSCEFVTRCSGCLL